MASQYIERRETGFYVVGSRVPIDRIVSEYQRGEDPETIRSHYPTLSLDQVKGAISFYLARKEEVDQVVEERKRQEAAGRAAELVPIEIREKFARMRRHLASHRT